MRNSNERRNFRAKAIKHGQQLQKDLGLRGGTLYEKHVEKIQEKPGIYDKGSISHYVKTNPLVKTNGKNYKQGSKISSRPSYKDQKSRNNMDDQEKEFKEEN